MLPPVQYTIAPASPQAPIAAPPFQRWHAPDGTTWAMFFRRGADFLVRFGGLGDFEVSADGGRVTAVPVPGVAAATVEHLFLNQALPLAISRQGQLVLHGSAVEIDGAAVAFIAPSRSGKSTLAASFAASGFRFLTDDGLVIRHEPAGAMPYFVEPTHPSIRLWDDSRDALLPSEPVAQAVSFSSKKRVLAGRRFELSETRRPLHRICVLDATPGPIGITPLGGRDAVMAMARNCFLLALTEREALERHYDQLLALARTVPFFTLRYPREFSLLPQVRAAIVEHGRSLASPPSPSMG